MLWREYPRKSVVGGATGLARGIKGGGPTGAENHDFWADLVLIFCQISHCLICKLLEVLFWKWDIVNKAGVLARTKTSSNALDATKLQSSVALLAQQQAGAVFHSWQEFDGNQQFPRAWWQYCPVVVFLLENPFKSSKTSKRLWVGHFQE